MYNKSVNPNLKIKPCHTIFIIGQCQTILETKEEPGI